MLGAKLTDIANTVANEVHGGYGSLLGVPGLCAVSRVILWMMYIVRLTTLVAISESKQTKGTGEACVR